MKRSLFGFVTLLSLASLLAGCGGSPTVSEVRWELERRFPQARFEPEEHVHLGRFTMGLLHGVASLAAHDKDDREGAVTRCRAAIATATDHEFEYRALAADGRILWLRDIIHVLRLRGAAARAVPSVAGGAAAAPRRRQRRR